MIKYFSMFSGIGGFEYGIQQSQYKNKAICTAYSEIDKYADSIYRRRFPSETINGIQTHMPFGDVTKIDTADLPDFELLVAGFPCQSFSIAGKGEGFDDCRGTLFFEIARVLADRRPKYFLLENVRNLLHHKKGETFQTIIRVLSDLGYNIEWQVLNSKEFVPQKRERIFLKGYSREKCGYEILSFKRKIEEYNKRKMKKDTGSCSNFENSDYEYVRRLTPVECERLQGFPDGWTEFGVNGEKISDAQRYKCLANAVTTNVITHIFNGWELIV